MKEMLFSKPGQSEVPLCFSPFLLLRFPFTLSVLFLSIPPSSFLWASVTGAFFLHHLISLSASVDSYAMRVHCIGGSLAQVFVGISLRVLLARPLPFSAERWLA